MTTINNNRHDTGLTTMIDSHSDMDNDMWQW